MSKESINAEYKFTTQQVKIVELVMQGYSNREIADSIRKGEQLIKYEMIRIFDAVGVNTRSRLMAKLWSLGWGFKTPSVQGSKLPVGNKR